jgi:hypothetical protein
VDEAVRAVSADEEHVALEQAQRRLAVHLGVHLALEHRVERQGLLVGELEAPLRAHRAVREHRSSGARTREQVGEDIHRPER